MDSRPLLRGRSRGAGSSRERPGSRSPPRPPAGPRVRCSATRRTAASRRWCCRATCTRRAHPQRFVFAIAPRLEVPRRSGPAQVAFAPPGINEGDVLDTNLYKDGLPKGRGIYVVDTVFPVAGVYKAAAIVDGKKVPFSIQVKDAAEAPVVGAQAPRAASPTPANTMGVNPICTRKPACPAARRLAVRRHRHRQAGGRDVRHPRAVPVAVLRPGARRAARPHGSVPGQDGDGPRRDLRRRTAAPPVRPPSRRGACRASRGSTRSTAPV